MKAIKYEKPWDVACVEMDKPVRKKGEALIKIMTAGICGSDIGAFRGTNGLVSYPRVIGHELAGIIEEIDEDNPKGFKVGDHVIVDPYLYCGHCYPCSIGRTNCCTDLHVLGVHVDGGMAEYFCHPADMLVKMPEGMDWVLAAMAEPLTISLHGVHRGGLKAGEFCAIYGAGPIGLLAAMVAEAYGAHAILIDVVQERLDFGKELGVEYIINSANEDPVAAVAKITDGTMAQLVRNVQEQTYASAAHWIWYPMQDVSHLQDGQRKKHPFLLTCLQRKKLISVEHVLQQVNLKKQSN